MTLFLFQDRHLKLIGGEIPTVFPALTTGRITLGPKDAFGLPGADPRTTAPRARPVRVLWNANEGIIDWEVELIEKVQAVSNRDGFKVELCGDRLVYSFEAQSLEEAAHVALSATQVLPPILSFRLRTFVWIQGFEVDVADSHFNVEIWRSHAGIIIASREHNESLILQGLDDWTNPNSLHPRCISALYYYRHAERLSAIEPDRSSLTAEVILNLAKAVEILFSPNRERVRSSIRNMGFDDAFIEKKIIPLLLLRNEMDVAHVASGPLDKQQKQTLTQFVSAAMANVHTLIELVLEAGRAGQIYFEPVSTTLDTNKAKLIGAIEQYVKEAAVQEAPQQSAPPDAGAKR